MRQFQNIKILFIFYFFEFPGSILENEACKLSTTVTFTRAFSTISHCGLVVHNLFFFFYWMINDKLVSISVFSLTWPASMQIYWNKRKRLHKKRVQLPQDWFGTPTWPPFHCRLGHQYGRRDVMCKRSMQIYWNKRKCLHK